MYALIKDGQIERHGKLKVLVPDGPIPQEWTPRFKDWCVEKGIVKIEYNHPHVENPDNYFITPRAPVLIDGKAVVEYDVIPRPEPQPEPTQTTETKDGV